MYTPTLVDIQLTNLPRAIAPSVLTPAPSLRAEEEGALVNCIKVNGTSSITYTCEELPPELESAIELENEKSNHSSMMNEKERSSSSTSLPKKYLCAGETFLRFHAHPSTVTLSSIKVFCGKRSIKVESVKPLFDCGLPQSGGSSESSPSASEGKKAKSAGGTSRGGKGALAASSSSSAAASSSPSSSSSSTSAADYGLYEVKLGEALPSGPSAVGQNIQLVAQFTTLCRPATAHGTIGMYYYLSNSITAGSSASSSSSVGNYVATTHFEVTHARRAFPCVDDIEVRTRWKISVGFGGTTGGGSGASPVVYSCAALDDSSQTSSVFSFQTLSTPIPAYAFAFLAASSSDLFASVTTGDDGADRSTLVTDRGTELATQVLVGSAFHAQHPQLASFGLTKLHEAVAALEDLFDAPLPIEGKLDLVFMGKMTPALAGMEHHGLIYIADSVWTGGPLARSAAGGPKQRDEVASLIIHELCHHWLGNAIGMPFAYKEGLCQVLEVCMLDVIEGKPIRKLATNMAEAAATSTNATAPNAVKQHNCTHHKNNNSGSGSSKDKSNESAGKKGGGEEGKPAAMSQACEGKELTGLTYQKAFAEMAAVAADWNKFVDGLRKLVSDKMGEYVSGEEVSTYFQ